MRLQRKDTKTEEFRNAEMEEAKVGIRANRGKRYVMKYAYTPSGKYPTAIAVAAGTRVVPISQHQQPGADWWKVRVVDGIELGNAGGAERAGFVPRACIAEEEEEEEEGWSG